MWRIWACCKRMHNIVNKWKVRGQPTYPGSSGKIVIKTMYVFVQKGSSIQDVCKNTVKIDLPSPLLSALGPTPSLPSCGRLQMWLITQWTVTHGHPVITRCPWVTAVGTCRTQNWLQAVSRCYLSIACTSNASVYMLRAAIYWAGNFISIFVTKYHTLLHVADVHSH